MKRFSPLRKFNKMYRGLVGILKPIIIFIFPYCKFYLYLNVYLNFLCILQIDIVHHNVNSYCKEFVQTYQ